MIICFPNSNVLALNWFFMIYIKIVSKEKKKLSFGGKAYEEKKASAYWLVYSSVNQICGGKPHYGYIGLVMTTGSQKEKKKLCWERRGEILRKWKTGSKKGIGRERAAAREREREKRERSERAREREESRKWVREKEREIEGIPGNIVFAECQTSNLISITMLKQTSTLSPTKSEKLKRRREKTKGAKR